MDGVESDHHVNQNKPNPKKKTNMFSPIYIIEA